MPAYNIQLHAADYAVFALALALSLAIGIYSGWAGRKDRTKNAYLLGNRELKLLPVSASLVASIVSAVTLLGMPAETYYYGMQIILAPIGAVWVFALLTIFYVPLIYPLRLTSVYEYIELRFDSHATRILATLTSILSELAFVGVVLYGPATTAEALFGLPTWASLIGLTTICTVYTTLGGIKAVVWTDAFQMVVMIGGLITVAVMGTYQVGGVSNVMHHLQEGGRLEFDFDWNPWKRMTVWLATVSFMFFPLAMFTGQGSVQRFSSLPTMARARAVYPVAFIPFVLFIGLSSVTGGVAYSYYSLKGCDPLAAGFITNPNQIIPYFVSDILNYPGLPGLFVACLFSAALSTVSSVQNSLAANIWEDFLRLKYDYLPERIKLLILKFIVVCIGVVTLAVSFLASAVKGNLLQLAASLPGAIIGPRLAMFMLGATAPFVGPWACSIGTVTGVVATIILALINILDPANWPILPTPNENCPHGNLSGGNGSLDMVSLTPYGAAVTMVTPVSNYTTDNLSIPPSNKFYQVSIYFYTTFGFLLTVLVALLFSIITAFRMKTRVNRKYLIVSCEGKTSDKEDILLAVDPSSVKHATQDECLTDEERELSSKVRRSSSEEDKHMIGQSLLHGE